MNKTNKSHKAFAIKKDTSPWRLASPPPHTGGWLQLKRVSSFVRVKEDERLSPTSTALWTGNE
jgi:hypothetical protein